MAVPIAVSKTWVTGETITAAGLNGMETNIINNGLIPAGIDDASASVSAMRSTTDPYPASAESLATDLAGEIARLRYLMAQATGKTYWYQDPDISLATISSSLSVISSQSRPLLTFINVTTVDVAANTSTANQTSITFPDGTVRTVTEDTAVTNKYRRFVITAAAEFTSGTEDSGLRSGISEANNTWYAIYAVKSTIDSTKFVLAGDTTEYIPTNYSTLNTRYGTNGYVYLGLIRNGDNAGATGDILNFYMSGNTTSFVNTVSTAVSSTTGLRLANNTVIGSITYTYSSGTGTTDLPSTINTGSFTVGTTRAAADRFLCKDSAAAVVYCVHPTSTTGTALWALGLLSVKSGVQISCESGSNVDYTIVIRNFIDSALV